MYNKQVLRKLNQENILYLKSVVLVEFVLTVISSRFARHALTRPSEWSTISTSLKITQPWTSL